MKAKTNLKGLYELTEKDELEHKESQSNKQESPTSNKLKKKLTKKGSATGSFIHITLQSGDEGEHLLMSSSIQESDNEGDI